MRKVLIILILFLISFTQSKLFQGKDIVDDAKCTIGDIDEANSLLNPLLNKLRKTTFFKIFKVDLESECPYWRRNFLCSRKSGSDEPPSCSVCKCNETEIPEPWKIKFDNNKKNNKVNPFSKLVRPWKDEPKNLWFPKQEESKMTYANLLLNPEGNTGYVGKEANRVWQEVYSQNCFKGKLEDMCLEQRVFYRLVSGFHSSVSMHIIHKFFNQKDVFNVNNGKPLSSPNYDEYKNRFEKFPERIQNLFFIYTFYIRAIQKVKPFLINYDFNTGNKTEDDQTKDYMNELLQTKVLCHDKPIFDESIIFRNAEKYYLIQQIREHFYNISTVMDCVACEKCRLWAKLQTLGLATALKIVLSEDTDECITSLQRNEIIAFFNGFRQLSTSVKIEKKFRMMNQRKEYSFYIPYIIGFSVGLFALFGLFSPKGN